MSTSTFPTRPVCLTPPQLSLLRQMQTGAQLRERATHGRNGGLHKYLVHANGSTERVATVTHDGLYKKGLIAYEGRTGDVRRWILTPEGAAVALTP